MKNIQKKIFLSVTLIFSILTGCGYTGDKPINRFNGKMIDSPVEGLHWICGINSGTTLPDGIFGECAIDTNVTFSIGNIILGTVAQTKDGLYTINDFLALDRNLSLNTTTQNNEIYEIGALLLSLDDDGDASNGIKIDQTLISSINTQVQTTISPLNGDVNITTLSNIQLNEIIDNVFIVNRFTNTEAETHIKSTLQAILDGNITLPTQPTARITGATGASGGTP